MFPTLLLFDQVTPLKKAARRLLLPPASSPNSSDDTYIESPQRPDIASHTYFSAVCRVLF